MMCARAFVRKLQLCVSCLTSVTYSTKMGLPPCCNAVTFSTIALAFVSN